MALILDGGANTIRTSTEDYLASIRRDLAKTNLQIAVETNRTAFNLQNSFIDQFENDSGIGSTSDVFRDSTYEFISPAQDSSHSSDSNTLLLIKSDTTNGATTLTDSSSNSHALTNYNIDHITATSARDASSMRFDYDSGSNQHYAHTTNNSTDFNICAQSNNWTLEFWWHPLTGGVNSSGYIMSYGTWMTNWVWALNGGTGGLNPSLTFRDGTNWDLADGVTIPIYSDSTTLTVDKWQHLAWSCDNGTGRAFVDGVLTNTVTGINETNSHSDQLFIGAYFGYVDTTNYKVYDKAYIDNIRFSDVARYTAAFSPEKSINASGNVISTAQTASTSRSKVSGVITYKDNAGTATLGTDLKIYFTCNGGTNWTEASSYTAGSDFSTGIKTAYLGETSCTAGTDVRYKAEWANQGTAKETRLQAIGVNY
jgi:hypothetical protein